MLSESLQSLPGSHCVTDDAGTEHWIVIYHVFGAWVFVTEKLRFRLTKNSAVAYYAEWLAQFDNDDD